MDAKRKQRIYAALRRCEAEMNQAGEESISWERRNQILELAELLPEAEELAWKAQHMPTLRRAACGPPIGGSRMRDREGSISE